MIIKSSDLQGASALIFTGPCHLIGVSFTGDIAQIPTLLPCPFCGKEVEFGVYNTISPDGDWRIAHKVVDEECPNIDMIATKEDLARCWNRRIK
jgi:hypothetical protein